MENDVLDVDNAVNMAKVGIDYAIEIAPKAVGALLLLFVAWLIAGWLGSMLTGGLRKAKIDETLSKFFGRTIRYVVIVFALLTCLEIFGVETTSFAAVVGGATVAIGLAFQGTLSNFSAGIMLLFFRPFKVGQYVKTSSCEGIVQEISLFTTEFDTLDNRRIIVPNGKIFGDVIENYSHNPYRRVGH